MEVLHNVQLISSIVVAAFVLLSVQTTDANHLMWKRQANDEGTTLNLREIFQGRCHEHLQCLQNDQCSMRQQAVNCTAIWETFVKAFRGIDPCKSTEDVYDEIFTMAPPITPKDETLFWSGLLDAALNVARVSKLYRILEESLPGYMANNLLWCGDSNSTDGINYKECPSSYVCPNGSYAFWRAASREFSKQAEGRISVALNAHREGGAFKNTSTFAAIELPNLNPKKITMVEILLVPDITKPKNESERCGEGSIGVLERLLTQNNFTWTCRFDPSEFRFIQCTTLENPENYPACNGGDSGGKEFKEIAIITGAVLGAIILILVIILIILAIQISRRMCGSSQKAEDRSWLTNVET